MCKDADGLSLECEDRQDPVEIVKLITKSNSFSKNSYWKIGNYYRIERTNKKVKEWLEVCIGDVISDKFVINNRDESLIFCCFI